MDDLSRKEFLRLVSWGFIASLLPLNTINALTPKVRGVHGQLEDDFQTAVKLASEAKRQFYLKLYEHSQSLYLQAINLAPSYIQFYDGLDNVFGAQNRNLESAILFKNALEINSTKTAFYDRAARALLRLQTGNKRETLKYKENFGAQSLLNDAKTLYEQAREIDNTKAFLNIGLAKVNRKIQIAAFEEDFRKNKVYKNIKVQTKLNYKSYINNKSNEDIRSLISKIDSKKRRPLIDIKEIEYRKINIIKQKKKLYAILFKRENLTSLEKIHDAEKLFQIDYKDPLSLKRIKIVYYTNNKYFEFIEVRRNFANESKKIYGYIGLMDAMELAYRKGQASSETLEEAISIGIDLLKKWSLNFVQEIEVVIKTVKILVMLNNFEQAKNVIEETLVKVKSTSTGMNNKLIISYAKIFFKEGNFELTEQILLIGLKEDEGIFDELIASNTKLQLISNLAKNKQKESFKDNLALYYCLYSVYEALQNFEKKTFLLSRIYLNNPSDNFVLTRN